MKVLLLDNITNGGKMSVFLFIYVLVSVATTLYFVKHKEDVFTEEPLKFYNENKIVGTLLLLLLSPITLVAALVANIVYEFKNGGK